MVANRRPRNATVIRSANFVGATTSVTVTIITFVPKVSVERGPRLRACLDNEESAEAGRAREVEELNVKGRTHRPPFLRFINT
jgi:hypothetical protein